MCALNFAPNNKSGEHQNIIFTLRDDGTNKLQSNRRLSVVRTSCTSNILILQTIVNNIILYKHCMFFSRMTTDSQSSFWIIFFFIYTSLTEIGKLSQSFPTWPKNDWKIIFIFSSTNGVHKKVFVKLYQYCKW